MQSNNEIPLSCQMNQSFIQQQQASQLLWEERQTRFKKLGAATLLYALFYTFCIYRNLAGITMPCWIAATIIYACYALNRFEIPRKKDGLFHIVMMILLGISTVFTGNVYIIALNYIGFFLLLLSFLLHTIYDDKEWGIGTYLWKITLSILGAIGKISAPCTDRFAFSKLYPKKTNKKLWYTLLGLAMAIPSILFLTVLLASADAVFQNFLVGALTGIVLPTNWIGAGALFLFAFFSAYCGLSQLLSNNSNKLSAVHTTHKVTSLIAIAFTSPITVLYVLFSLIQVVYLFLGFGTLPDGMSYAEYARTGFFQLLFICFFNFCLVLFVQNYVEENRLLRAILLTICGSTFIMIVSSGYRMILYIAAYQLTFLRVFVLVTLTIIALLMAGVVASLFCKQFPIFKYSLIVVSCIYVAFSFSHIDYFIASYNFSHIEDSSSDSLQYIGTLSSDAAPVIAEYIKQHTELQEKVDSAYENRKPEEGDWIYGVDDDTSWYIWYTQKIRYLSENSSPRRFNVSHYIASKAFDL